MPEKGVLCDEKVVEHSANSQRHNEPENHRTQEVKYRFVQIGPVLLGLSYQLLEHLGLQYGHVLRSV